MKVLKMASKSLIGSIKKDNKIKIKLGANKIDK